VRWGLTRTHASKLARRGWLQRLGHGIYLLPGDELTRDGALAFLAARVPGFHVGGKTALHWRGVRHNVAVSEVLSLWGARWQELPAWFTARFPSHYQSSTLFGAEADPPFGVGPLPDGDPAVPVSVPERAMLELLSDVGRRQSLEEARHLVEGLPSLRPRMLAELLDRTDRIKVVRLAARLAKEAGHGWAEVAATRSKVLGGATRIILNLPGEGHVDLRQ
jgi:hypothetical protein